MTRTKLMTLTAMTLVIGASTAAAQGLSMMMKPDSKLSIAGSSNVHGWSCGSTAFVAQVEVDSGFAMRPFNQIARPIGKVAVTIPVKTLKCGKAKMDDNMYKALNEPQYPDIRYMLQSYTIDLASVTAASFIANTVGDLTVAGKTIKVAIPVKTERQLGGGARGEGTVDLKMTDFGIKPPVALLGTLRTRDAITISFTVQLDRNAVVALSGYQP